MTPRTTASLALCLIAAAACAGAPPAPTARLPPDAVVGAGDPTRAAIMGSAYAFGQPGSIAGRPDAAARAVAQVEYLAAEIPTGPRWVEFSPLVGLELARAQAELRATLGLAPAAPPQAVVDALYAAARALQAGDRAGAERALDAATAAGAGDGGHGALVRLAALPPLPRTRVATALAEREMIRVDQDSRFSGPSGGGDGRQ